MHSQLTLRVLCYFDPREAVLHRMRVVKTANNLPTMFVLERVESDPEYDQLKAELYELGDYVSMRYAVGYLSVLYCIQVALRGLTVPPHCANRRRTAVQVLSWPCTRPERVLETIYLDTRGNSLSGFRSKRVFHGQARSIT